MSYPAFPQYSSVDYSKKKNRRGNSGVSITETTEPHITENSEPLITENSEPQIIKSADVSSSGEVKSQKYIEVGICNPNEAVQEGAIAEVDAVGLNFSEEDDKAVNGAEVEISLHGLEEKPPVQGSPYMPISAETLDSNIAVSNTTQRYEKAAPKSSNKNVSSHSFRKMLVTALLMNIVLCLIVCGILGYVLYDLHQLKLKFLSQNFSCLSSHANNSDATVPSQMGDENDEEFQCFNNQCQESLENLNETILNYFEKNHENQDLLISILNNPNLLFTVSCATIYATSNSSPSGFYWFRAPNGSFVSMYCDMDRTCGSVAGGWTRLVKWDMSDCNDQCPPDFIPQNYFARSCGIRLSLVNSECSMTNFSLPNKMEYSKVCGRVKAYSVGSTNAFMITDIDSVYVDGVSLTHGAPGNRTHIWTFAASEDNSKCPCHNVTGSSYEPPSFVGSDYFCDTPVSNSPLWVDCSHSGSCCHNNTFPWFFKELTERTSDPIELRVCADDTRANEDVAIELVEIYVQ